MCAILDASVASEVFSPSRSTDAGVEFLDWIERGKNRLVIGGKLTEELEATEFSNWFRQKILAGQEQIIRNIDASQITTKTQEIKSKCQSDDPHIIALAQISGARLLYSNDVDLQGDFKRKELIDNPRGKIYTTLERQFSRVPRQFSRVHKDLLQQKNLCRS